MEVSGKLNSFVLWLLYCQGRDLGTHYVGCWVCPTGSQSVEWEISSSCWELNDDSLFTQFVV
jgi:hypothetical protein